MCGYASYYLAEQWDYDTLENKELLRIDFLNLLSIFYSSVPVVGFKDVRVK